MIFVGNIIEDKEGLVSTFYVHAWGVIVEVTVALLEISREMRNVHLTEVIDEVRVLIVGGVITSSGTFPCCILVKLPL